jgi:hypothetical protein
VAARPGRPVVQASLAGARRRRNWRVPAALILLVVFGGVVIALLTPRSQRVNSYLDPASNAAGGGHALTDILGERGLRVIHAYSPGQALAAAGAGQATLVITSPELLTARQRTRLASTRADVVLVAPGRVALGALAPSVFVENNGPESVVPLKPGCGLAAARLAGSADLAGYSYDTVLDAVQCYLAAGYPALVRYTEGGKTTTIVGSGLPFTNAYLAQDGNAALALNLLSGRHRVVWLTPEPKVLPAHGPPGASRHAPALLPAGVSLLLVQLVIVVALTIVWRARRFGPLIAERLPVVVRASETVEGHGRLYQSRRARDRAAAALRWSMLARVEPALGLVRGAPPEAVTDALAARSRLSQAEVAAIVYGQAPASDAELVRLARSLDELESEVRSL